MRTHLDTPSNSAADCCCLKLVLVSSSIRLQICGKRTSSWFAFPSKTAAAAAAADPLFLLGRVRRNYPFCDSLPLPPSGQRGQRNWELCLRWLSSNNSFPDFPSMSDRGTGSLPLLLLSLCPRKCMSAAVAVPEWGKTLQGSTCSVAVVASSSSLHPHHVQNGGSIADVAAEIRPKYFRYFKKIRTLVLLNELKMLS